MQTELLKRRCWKTRLELAAFDCPGMTPQRQRQPYAPVVRTQIGFEQLHQVTQAAA